MAELQSAAAHHSGTYGASGKMLQLYITLGTHGAAAQRPNENGEAAHGASGRNGAALKHAVKHGAAAQRPTDEHHSAPRVRMVCSCKAPPPSPHVVLCLPPASGQRQRCPLSRCASRRTIVILTHNVESSLVDVWDVSRYPKESTTPFTMSSDMQSSSVRYDRPETG